jgi:hypothetical protein
MNLGLTLPTSWSAAVLCIAMWIPDLACQRRRCYHPVMPQPVEDLTPEQEAQTRGYLGLSPGANKYDATSAPTVDDDSSQGYLVGSEWIDVINGQAYKCVDGSVGAAVWVPIDNSQDYATIVPIVNDVVISGTNAHWPDNPEYHADGRFILDSMVLPARVPYFRNADEESYVNILFNEVDARFEVWDIEGDGTLLYRSTAPIDPAIGPEGVEAGTWLDAGGGPATYFACTGFNLLESHHNKVLTYTPDVEVDKTIIIPEGLPVGWHCTLIQVSESLLHFEAADGVTLVCRGNETYAAGCLVELLVVDENVVVLSGDVAALL